MSPDKLNANALNSAVENTLKSQMGMPLQPGLYLVATPIGNLADISIRALSILAKVDIIYCEDTRHSKKLFEHYAIKAQLKSYHDHDGHKKRTQILNDLKDGLRIALISDAGTPLISDPGFKLVRDVVEHGFHIESLPGASAAMVALTVSGLPTDRFLFEGFLAAKQTQRMKQLEKLKTIEASLIFFETANRLDKSLADMYDILGKREAVVARELSKKYETLIRGDLCSLTQTFHETTVKGEIVIVVAPPLKKVVSDQDILFALQERFQNYSMRDNVKKVTEELEVSKNRVYNLALTIKPDN